MRFTFLSSSGVSAEDEHIGLDISMHNESMSGLKVSQLKAKELDLSPKYVLLILTHIYTTLLISNLRLKSDLSITNTVSFTLFDALIG
jgi:hypothetical protein